VYFIASDHKIIINEKLKDGEKQSWPILMFAYTSPGNLHGKLRKLNLPPGQCEVVSSPSVDPPLVSGPLLLM
jgi:hypothetical protein